MHRNKNILLFAVLGVGLAALFVADLCLGSTLFPLRALWEQGEGTNSIYHHILVNIRLPKALTAILAGSALSVSGILMQTLFRNPLAGPYILGVSSGASLGVAFVVMCTSLFGMVSAGAGAVAMAAIIGSTLVLLLVMSVAGKVKDNVSLLIVGMMVGAIAGALVNIMQNIANPDALKLFIVWTLGSLSAVGWSELTVMAVVLLAGALMVIMLLKPLNGLLLGESYARALGVNIQRTRIGIVLATSLLAGGVTAWCGPIAFIGVAVPHLARGIMHTSNHRLTVPACALLGANLLLLCDCMVSVASYSLSLSLPISTLSSLVAAPIIIYVILKM
jgi:iron complex transport system permease protein